MYWLLSQPLALQSDHGARATALLRSVATAVSGDLLSAEPARILRVPGTLNHKYNPPRAVSIEVMSPDRRYELADFLSIPPESSTEKASPPLGANIVEGGRNATLFSEGCRLRRLGWDEPEIFNALAGINQHRCNPPLLEPELLAIARSCVRYEPQEDPFPLTEAGDAEFFVHGTKDFVRYDHRRGRWLVFSHHRWVPQTNGELLRLALAAMRARQASALRSTGEGRAQRIKWALAGESGSRLRSLLSIAQNLEPVADAGDGWDDNPWLLGTPNGVVDLRTGSLRDGTPNDRITMSTRVPFDPEASCPLFDKVIREIFNDDPKTIAYIDRYIGYSITGDCQEESLAICWGGGANGKGTLMNTIGWILGDYADDLPFSAFELHSRAGIPNDIAKLVNKRFVTASETGEAQRLNEARIKALTGRDPITARFLHKEFFTFEPNAKFWLATNHRPDVHDDSEGLWRRLHLIPFTASFIGREDRTLKERLRAEGPGILARAVRGCLAWQERGLDPPELVRTATEAYRAESMPLAQFLDERCIVHEDARVTFGELFKAYVQWSGRSDRMGKHAFNTALRQQFRPDDRNKQRVVFLGVGLLVSEGQSEL